ncbi:TipAS antibiotic-recognition domain-containing protein [Pseudarthrobacter sp. SSS035]|uniref:TipAS antibiotic-recognition domain-containing protein n=1 Tax=Pseudarthrobacter sp. SSS035 TaxID=2931399 RepID=UPI002010806D|nr:TipAS antibiotic-recognition domain-containing protein [Pseudarthrobacter sp. SSS035]
MTDNLIHLPAIYLQSCREALAHEQALSLEASNGWAHVDRDVVHAEWDAVYRDLARNLDTSDPMDAASQDLIRKHYNVACLFYTPSKEAYIGMALFYEENKELNAFHATYHPGLVAFLNVAIRAYSARNL